MTMSVQAVFSPLEYIRRVCELHLECNIDDLNIESKAALDAFLQLGLGLSSGDSNVDNDVDSNNNDNDNPKSFSVAVAPRLFFWISKSKSNLHSTSKSKLLASTESYEADNSGALAFINTSNQPFTSRAQIQCITLTPLTATVTATGTDDDNDTLGSSNDPNADPNTTNANTANTANAEEDDATINSFRTLQLYTQHAFVPTLKSIHSSTTTSSSTSHNLPSHSTNNNNNNNNNTTENKILTSLETKIRELDMTLTQCRRSTLSSIPHITLTTHPILENASLSIPSNGKINLDELGISSDLLSNDNFLNDVQSIVNSWIPSIQKVTLLPSSSSSSSSSTTIESDWEEVSYWSNLSSALTHIQNELSKPSIQLTIHLLKYTKRFVSTIALENNIHLKYALEYVNDVTTFLKHYPAEQLSSVVNYTTLRNVLEEMLTVSIVKIRSNRYYGLHRFVNLVDASLATVKKRCEYIIKDQHKTNDIIYMNYKEYEEKVYNPFYDLFIQIEIWVKEFQEFAVELGRKRKIGNVGNLVEGMKLEHLVLKERLDLVHSFRVSHEQLRLVVSEVLMGEDDDNQTISAGTGGSGGSVASTALKDVEEAPLVTIGNIDVLDLSESGAVAFANALEKYERKIDTIEERLAKLLRDKLTACQVIFFIVNYFSMIQNLSTNLTIFVWF